jgi:Glycosyl hydrolases family 31 TIM-barrel domain
MKTLKTDYGITIEGDNYCLKYDNSDSMYVDLVFDNNIGAKLFVASGCDRDEMIDELVGLEGPTVEECSDCIKITFVGKTTLWEKAEYTFKCMPEKVLYSYLVNGKGTLDNVRFFEGFLEDNPNVKDKGYPFFCGHGRPTSYHRPEKFFMASSKRSFEVVYIPQFNSSDTRFFMYYENTQIRMDGTRNYLGGDWLAAPPPFQFMIGPRSKDTWVGMGLVVKPGENNFMQYQYNGGEEFGLNMTYDGFTDIDGCWESPGILFEMAGDVYSGLEKYTNYVRENGCVKKNDRSNMPRWWKEPIFGGWGEQVFLSRHWDDYYLNRSHDWSGSTFKYCSQQAYTTMLATLEKKGVNPTILIVDNRWFKEDSSLDVDEELWPDMKGFVQEQHSKGRKVILWISPWAYGRSVSGLDVPMGEHMIVDDKRDFALHIDTDVFYKECKKEKRKIRKTPESDTWNGEREWKLLVDPLNPDYEKRVRGKVQYLLSPEGLDADGFEFDYTHFITTQRGAVSAHFQKNKMWGVELFHHLLSIYYSQAKIAKSDALLISQTFNPYFDDVTDMLRLNDIYTDNKRVVEQFHHRAKIGSIVCPGCAIHTDQHPMPSMEAWREYAKFQPTIGNPALYYVTGIETTYEEFTDEDWAMLADVWSRYDAELTKQYGPKIISKSAGIAIKNKLANPKYPSQVCPENILGDEPVKESVLK